MRAALGLLCLLAGCGGDAAPERWTRLATHEARLAGERPAEVETPRRTVRLQHQGVATRLTTPIPRAAWTEAARIDADVIWTTPQPILAVGRSEQDGPYWLSLGDGQRAVSPELGAQSRPGDFSVHGALVHLRLEPGAEPPAETGFTALAAPRWVDDAGALAVEGRRLSGEGFVVWPGETIELDCTLRAGAVLRFATAVESAFVRRVEREGRRTFRVHLDGEPLFAYVEDTPTEALRWHAVDLPNDVERAGTLSFSVEGDFAYTAFLAPVIGPRAHASYAARPADAPRDLVLFVADTFRADLMSAYGGTEALTPRLDALARESLVFTEARSVATHTLPAHKTMFSGLYPRQVGRGGLRPVFPREVDTLAERLGRAGYRTAAITDGIMVSRAYGMHQGFATFDERRLGLDSTAERLRAILAADDGRPLFLFVQTYATHSPYEVDPELVAELASRLDLRGDPSALLEVIGYSEDLLTLDLEGAQVRAAVENLRRLYLGTAVQLDRSFGGMLDELRGSGLLDRGLLLFTSDHGEAFGEHDQLFHAGTTHEEQLRIPLLIHGADVAPGLDARPTDLIDLAPTVLSLAGLEVPGEWPGTALLEPAPDRPSFAFQARLPVPISTFAIVDGSRKLIGAEDPSGLAVGEWLGAYDLAADPGERVNLLDSDADWPRELADRHGEALERLLVPRYEAGDAALTPDQVEQLRAMGYVGD